MTRVLRISLALVFALPFVSSAFAKPPPQFLEDKILSCARALRSQFEKETIILTAPFSTGRFYAKSFKQLGFRVVALLPKADDPGVASTYQPEDFDAEIREGESFSALMAEVRKQGQIRLVLPASEGGVSLGLKVANELGSIPTNPDLAIYRDKYEMGTHLGETPQTQATSVAEALTFIRKHDLWKSGGVFIKPLLGSGSILGGHIRTEADLEPLFTKILATPDNYGHRNTHVLVQPYIQGPEYGVNAVVLGDQIVFSSIIHYDKIPVTGAGDLYRSDRILPFDGKAQEKLRTYFKALVKKFGIKIGPVHAEIKITPSGEPKLIELAVRQCGGNKALWEKYATHRSQIDLTIEAYLFPELFRRRTSEYSLNRQVMMVSVHTEGGQIMRSHDEIDSILSQVPGFHDRTYYQDGGAILKKSIDMDTFVVRVVLTSAPDEASILDQGRARILELERAGAFERRN